MLGGSFFTSMDEDPFFAAHRQHMQRMDAMFGNFPFSRPLGISDGSHPHQLQPQGRMLQSHHNNQMQQSHRNNQMLQSHRNNQMQPFGMFDSMFGNMFKNMRTMMADMQRGFVDVPNNQNGPCYSQQSFVSYSKTGNEAPKVFQSSSSTRSGPNGIKETHKTVRDSESGVEKMAIGRHINDRGHVMERSRNRKTGEEERNQNFINIDEDEGESFNDEWKEKVAPRGSRVAEHQRVQGVERPRPQRSHIPVRIQRSHGTSNRLALPAPVIREAMDASRRHTETRRYPDTTRRVGVETRRTDRRRATPRNYRDRD